LELGPSDFNGQELRGGETLAVLFLAAWCPFCTQFRPAFEAAAKASGLPWGSADLSDDDNVLWDSFKIDVVPTVVVFKHGKAVFRKDGVLGRGLSGEAIKEIIDQMKLAGKGD
jgi:thioredoxin-like negative regulator of GroEL